MKAKPGKLDDGTWGAWVQSHDVDVDSVLTLVTKKGKAWDVLVTEIVWRGEKNGDRLTPCRTVDLDGDRTQAAKRGCSCTCEACGHCEHRVAANADGVPF
jgi:hypothetical protein